ncbi:MAG: S24/S26 family peptidase, partial [Lachnospiraceae bacterium]|nr:S24/S26 family peptidase [Lachnospiraceae bacterium]
MNGLKETKEAFEAKKEVKTITSQAVEKELDRMRYQKRFALTMRSTIFTLVVVAAIAILVAVLLMPVLRIYGRSMNDTLDEGDIVVSVKTGTFETGDVIAFYY